MGITTLLLLSSALEIFCPSNSLVGSISSASILPQMVLRSQLVLGICLDSGAGRLLWVLGQAQVPGWPNQIEGKHLHLMAGGRDFSFSVGFDQGDIHLAATCDCQLPYNHEGNQPLNVTEAEDSSVETGKASASLGMVWSD